MKQGYLVLLGLGGAALLLRRTPTLDPRFAPAMAAIGALEAEIRATLVSEDLKTQEARERVIRMLLGGKVRKPFFALIDRSLKLRGRAINAFEFAAIYALDSKLATSYCGDRVLYDRLVREVGASSPLVSMANEKNISKVLRNAVLVLTPENQKKFAASCATRALDLWQRAVPGDRSAEKLVRAIQENASGALSDAELSANAEAFAVTLERVKKSPAAFTAGQAIKRAACNAYSLAANRGRVAASITELSRFVAKAETEAFKAERSASRPVAPPARRSESAQQRAFRESAEEASQELAQREARAATRSGAEATEETLDAALNRILRRL